MAKRVERIAVLTSGGDAPGMNAAIRAVVRAALDARLEVLGALDGFTGLLEGNLTPLDRKSVAGIGPLPGTILGTAREPRMREPHGPARAAYILEWRGVDALIVIGGNGSQHAARLMDACLPTVGIASTIDCDLACADATIGFDTAVNTAARAIDTLKATATSHRRMMVVQVMGRDCGALAVKAALAAGAERVVVPEVDDDEESILGDALAQLRGDPYGCGSKRHYVMVLAEGVKHVDGETLARRAQQLGMDARFTRLGHIQRGDYPTATDRALAATLGDAAVHALLVGARGGVEMPVCGKIELVPFDEALNTTGRVDRADVLLVQRLS